MKEKKGKRKEKEKERREGDRDGDGRELNEGGVCVAHVEEWAAAGVGGEKKGKKEKER